MPFLNVWQLTFSTAMAKLSSLLNSSGISYNKKDQMLAKNSQYFIYAISSSSNGKAATGAIVTGE